MRVFCLHLCGVVLLAGLASSANAQQRVEVTRADIGFGDQYKVGSWAPLRVQVVGGEKSINALADVRVPDSEGVATQVFSSPFNLPAGASATVELLVRVGQLEAPVEVRIIDLGRGKAVAKRTFLTRRELDNGGVAPGDPATTRLIVEVGPVPLGTSALDAEKSSEKYYTQNVVGRVTDLSTLPRSSMAYEAVDTVVISTSDRDSWSGMRADDPRMAALVEWVEHGGRVILFCGANADLVLADGGPLAELAPGEFADNATTDNLAALERYVQENEPLPGRGRNKIAVPQWNTLRGDVALSLGGRANPLPVVIRYRVGLGQVVFVGLDIDKPPLQNWNSRNRLLAMQLNFADESTDNETQNYYYDGPADIVLSLVQRFDRELEKSGIRTPPFLAIAGLVVLYILIIGPGDYLFVKHVLKRMEWTWVTFPAIVVITCLGAYWYATYLKGDSMRVTRVEIVDIDNMTGQSRGTLWSHIFSPSPDRYSLVLEAKSPSGEADSKTTSSVAWLGRPASGLGGMSSDAGSRVGQPVYGWSPDLSQMSGAPIEVWSTKTFVARWQSQTDTRLQSNLKRTGNNLVEGTIENPTSLALSNCQLVYGSWGWRLGSLPAGGSVSIEAGGIGNTAGAPKKLRNLFRNDYNFDPGQGSYYEKQQLVQRIELRGLAEMMMFYDALGGRSQSQQWNRYQHFVDLSHALDSHTAMIVGECNEQRSELARLSNPSDPSSTESMRGERDIEVVIYRYLLPVSPMAEE